MEEKIAYCYIKGNNYKQNKFWFIGNEELKEIEKTFDDDETMLLFVASFSDSYSIPIQFYY